VKGDQADLFVTILVVLCLPVVNLYPLFYAFRPWRTTPQGRALMVKAIGNMIVIDMAAATLLLGEDYPGRGTIRVIGFGLFLVGMYYLLWSLLSIPGSERFPPFSWMRRVPWIRRRAKADDRP
jgi:hypothetical protein